MTVVLVRHGATDWSDAGRFNGWTDVPLNDRGFEQAAALRAGLAGRSFAAVWSSDLSRAVDTARVAFDEPDVDARLRELDFGTLEGQRWDDLSSDRRKQLVAFDDFVAPGGESVADLRRRVWSFVNDLSAGPHLFFTHGGVIRCLLRYFGRDAHVAPGEAIDIDLASGPSTSAVTPR